MKKAYGIVVVIGFALAPWASFGQAQIDQPAAPTAAPAEVLAAALPPDQQATKEQIEKFFEVMRLRKQMQSMMEMMPGMIQQQFRVQLKDMSAKLPPGKRLMPQDQASLENVMNKYMKEAMDAYPVDEMLEDAVPVYQRHVSRTDADALIAFYSSPTGQRLLDEQPAIVSEYMSILMAHMQDRTARLTDEMKAEMEKLVSPELPASGNSNPRSN